jgi:hypothetical protein
MGRRPASSGRPRKRHRSLDRVTYRPSAEVHQSGTCERSATVLDQEPYNPVAHPRGGPIRFQEDRGSLLLVRKLEPLAQVVHQQVMLSLEEVGVGLEARNQLIDRLLLGDQPC